MATVIAARQWMEQSHEVDRGRLRLVQDGGATFAEIEQARILSSCWVREALSWGGGRLIAQTSPGWGPRRQPLNVSIVAPISAITRQRREIGAVVPGHLANLAHPGLDAAPMDVVPCAIGG